MRIQVDAGIEHRIRTAIKLGEPYALDELTDTICADDVDRALLSEIVADEYRRRLQVLPREHMLELYRECYQDASDANRDWLLGEIVESVEADRS
jgi:hypothetical protein